MKKLALILILNIAFLSFATGQILAFNNAYLEYEEEQVQSVEVILKPNVDLLEDKFNAWLKDNHDVKLDQKKFIFFDKEYLTANEVIIPKISDRKIDLKVKVQSTPNDKTRLNVFASFGYNNWISESEYPEEYAALEKLTYSFVQKYLPEYYNQKIENNQTQIIDLKEDNNDILSTIKSNKEEMANLEKTNNELLADWKDNKSKLQTLKVKLDQLEYEYDHVVNKTNK
jgi:hypothetical protein